MSDVNTEWCRRCLQPNVVWSASSPLWNYVMRGNDINGQPRYGDLVCMTCFVKLAIEAGVPALGWRLIGPEPEDCIYETPSGRVWDSETFQWVDSSQLNFKEVSDRIRHKIEKDIRNGDI